MKGIIITFINLALFALFSNAQQRYLLIPSDSPGTITIEENYNLNRITNEKVKVNRISKFNGFRIEIYQGDDRKEAENILKEFKEEYPNIPAEMVFEKPYVKVKIGIYRNKLEAQSLFSILKKEYDGTKIVYGKGLPFPPLVNEKKKQRTPNDLNKKIEDF